jgi:hypothetical protein
MTFVAAFPTKLALLTRRVPIAYTKTFSETSKTIEAPKKNVFKPFSDLYFAYDVLRKNFPRSFTEITAIHELFKRYSEKRFYELVNVVEILKKVTLKLFSEPILIHEVFRKDFPKTFAEVLKTYEVAKRVIIRRAFDALYGEHVPYFYRGKAFLEVLRLSDRFTELSLKRLLEIAKSQEIFSRSTIKIFRDLPKAIEIPRKNISKRFAEQYFIRELIKESFLKHVVDLVLTSDLISKYVITDLVDANRLLDVLSKHTGKIIEFETAPADYHRRYVQHTKVVSDLFSITDMYKLFPLKRLLEIAKSQEIFSRSTIKIFRDLPKAIEIPRKNISKRFAEQYFIRELIKESFLKHVVDLVLTSDLISKYVITDLVDANRLLDVLSKHTGKIIEFETAPADYHRRYVQHTKVVSDLFSITDMYKLFPLKRLLEIAKSQEIFSRTVIVTRIFMDEVLSEFTQSKHIPIYKKDIAESIDFIKKLTTTSVHDLALTYEVLYKTFIKYLRDFWYDTGLVAKSPSVSKYDLSYSVEIVAKVLYTLMQKTVRRVYFLPPEYEAWWDIILASDHNTKVLVCKAFLDAFKRVSDKLLGVRVPVSDICKVSDSVEVITA